MTMTSRLPLHVAATALPRGILLMRRDPSLRALVYRGMWVNLVSFLIFVAALVWGAWLLVGLIVTGDHWALDLVRWLVKLTVVAAAIYVAPVLYSMVSAIILPKYRSRVYDRARMLAGGADDKPSGGVKAEVYIATVEARRLARLVAITVAILPLHLLPGVGSVVYLVTEVLVAAHTLGWNLLSYHFERHGATYAEQKEWLRKNRLGVLVLGLVGTLLYLIPIAQVLFMFTNVAGVGLLSAELDRRK
jgi:CysZ protein